MWVFAPRADEVDKTRDTSRQWNYSSCTWLWDRLLVLCCGCYFCILCTPLLRTNLSWYTYIIVQEHKSLVYRFHVVIVLFVILNVIIYLCLYNQRLERLILIVFYFISINYRAIVIDPFFNIPLQSLLFMKHLINIHSKVTSF